MIKMVINLFYSTLSDEVYRTEEEAQKAEDEYVNNYFKELSRDAEVKRRMRRSIVSGYKSPEFLKI